jgi:hypothetical protein
MRVVRSRGLSVVAAVSLVLGGCTASAHTATRVSDAPSQVAGTPRRQTASPRVHSARWRWLHRPVKPLGPWVGVWGTNCDEAPPIPGPFVDAMGGTSCWVIQIKRLHWWSHYGPGRSLDWDRFNRNLWIISGHIPGHRHKGLIYSEGGNGVHALTVRTGLGGSPFIHWVHYPWICYTTTTHLGSFWIDLRSGRHWHRIHTCHSGPDRTWP